MPVLALLLAIAACGGRGAPDVVHVVGKHARSLSGHLARLSLPLTLPDRVVHVPILMYHRIDRLRPSLPAITKRLTVDPRAFGAQMTWLVRHGRHAITQQQLFEALMHGAALPPHSLLITFDDGYRDVLGEAAPVLARLRLPATAYVITDRISNGDPSFLTWGDLRALERDGIAIGSHTVSHADLPALPEARAWAELLDSRAALERRLGHPVQWLAYPFGREDARIVALARRAGYVLAATTRAGADQQARDPLRLHRYEVLDTTSLATLAAYTR